MFYIFLRKNGIATANKVYKNQFPAKSLIPDARTYYNIYVILLYIISTAVFPLELFTNILYTHSYLL